MRQSWMRNILLFSTVMVVLASCKDPEFSLDEPLTASSRPAVYISGQNNFLYALDPKTGERIWEKFFGINRILQEPIVLKDYTIVNTLAGIVRLNGLNGDVVDTIRDFEFDGAKHPVAGMICGKDNMLYSGTADNYLVGFNIDGMSVMWRAMYGSAPTAMTTTGTVYGNLLIANLNGTLYAVNKGAGTEVTWTATIPASTDPVVAPPYVYVLGKDGVLHALDIETGLELWTYTTGAPTESSPIVYGGNIIYGADNNQLYCIDPIAQAPRWVFPTNERVQGSAYADEQVVYFGSFDNYMYAVNIIDGQLKWRYRANALIKSSPIVTNGVAYFASYDQHMYAFDTTGLLKWKFRVNAPVDMSPVANNLDNKVVYPAVSGLSTQ